MRDGATYLGKKFVVIATKLRGVPSVVCVVQIFYDKLRRVKSYLAGIRSCVLAVLTRLAQLITLCDELSYSLFADFCRGNSALKDVY